MRKIGVITGARAEYGLLQPLMRRLAKDRQIQLQIFVSGMHLAPEFGLTYKTIEADGFVITDKIEILLSSDTSIGLAKSISLGIIGFSQSFERNRPDIVVILGDRFEAFAAASAALVCKIPIAHIHGGESTEGALDESFRHAITKMSAIHFPTTEFYACRIRYMGENPNMIFCIGAPGIDAIKNTNLLSKKDLELILRWQLPRKFALCTYHPATIESLSVGIQMRYLFQALNTFPELPVLFTMPNADPGGREIKGLIESYAHRNPNRVKAYTSLGQRNYLSLLKYSSVMIGNSSSGIIEAPYFKLPVVNIGERQAGRIRASNVIDCTYTSQAIAQAIKKALSRRFRIALKDCINPYDNGDSSSKMLKILKTIPLTNELLKKRFHDISYKENIFSWNNKFHHQTL
jgi:UDP-hydrolysing UDP-N-acetyl-D-glucosamine 2-epimerase